MRISRVWQRDATLSGTNQALRKNLSPKKKTKSPLFAGLLKWAVLGSNQ
jgi:hypothetical protein